MFDALLAILAPHTCLSCDKEGSLWCGACRSAALSAPERCYGCQRLSAGGRTCVPCRRAVPLYAVRAATRYDGVAKRLVWQLKFERAQAGAAEAAALIADRLSLPADAILVPVPTVTRRVRRRGYDQAVLITRQLARLQRVRQCTILLRLGQKQQRNATRAQRLSQLSEDFRVVDPSRVAGTHIVLVDDVITTGATLEAAARALKAAGAKRVSAVVFAQA